MQSYLNVDMTTDITPFKQEEDKFFLQLDSIVKGQKNGLDGATMYSVVAKVQGTGFVLSNQTNQILTTLKVDDGLDHREVPLMAHADFDVNNLIDITGATVRLGVNIMYDKTKKQFVTEYLCSTLEILQVLDFSNVNYELSEIENLENVEKEDENIVDKNSVYDVE